MLHSQQQTDMEMSMWRDCKPTKNYAQQSAHCLNDLNVYFCRHQALHWFKLSTSRKKPSVHVFLFLPIITIIMGQVGSHKLTK